MILRTCDRCGKEMEPIYFPPYGNPMTYGIDPLGSTEFKPQLFLSVPEPGGKVRPMDICDKCNLQIMDYIFGDSEVTKNG